MRFARFFTVLCSVDLNALDLTLREHRIKALIRVEKTGVYHYYSRKGLKKLYADNAKKRTLTWDWSTTTPAFMGHYYFSPEIKSAINQLKTNYMKRFKMEAGRTYKRELIKRLSGLDNDESLNTTLA